MSVYRAFICGLEGTALSSFERGFLRETGPCGVILFKRNCETPGQVYSLSQSIRELFGDARYFILTDQEGGRVQRLGPPHWRRYPAGGVFAAVYQSAPEKALEAAYALSRLIAADLRAVGVNVNCAPVLDVPVPGAHDIIGDRAYGSDPATVAVFGRAVAQGYLDGGILPVIKHIPGHGRANADSHVSLPVIKAPLDELRTTDFAPFKALRDMPMAMTAHVLIDCLDVRAPASASETVIQNIIRGEIGFDGVLMCDDLSMGALSGDLAGRTRAVLAAGCDVALHCNGKLKEMQVVADASPPLHAQALERFERAASRLDGERDYDLAAAHAILSETLAEWA